uniref:Uncharacterized protein n=1 Tax=Arundo donax TaxID=35708 RepID=A0A0A9FP00_ARUDO
MVLSSPPPLPLPLVISWTGREDEEE